MDESFVNRIRETLKEASGEDIESIHRLLIDMAKGRKGKVYLVGGAVRDEYIRQFHPELANELSKDMDYTVTGKWVDAEDLAREIEKTFRHIGGVVAETKNDTGTVILNLDNEPYEFTLPRTDIDRVNVKVDASLPIEKDLERRDFTMNALAKDLETGTIHQPEGYDGISDIKNGLIRAVGNPADRFNEDKLRMLRAIQFATRFGFEIGNETWTAIQNNVDGFKGIAKERYRNELIKAWTKGNKDTAKFFTLMKDSGVSDFLFGNDFKPIPIKTNDLSPDVAFDVQYIAAFLNGGDYESIGYKKEDMQLIEISRWFKNAIENGIDYKDVKRLKKKDDFIERTRLAFSKIDNDLLQKLDELISKPFIPRERSDKWKPWEVPVLGGEISELSGGKIQGRAIPEAEVKLAKAFQDGTIESFPSSEEKTKDAAISYIKTNLLNDMNIKEQMRLDTLEERMRNILYK